MEQVKRYGWKIALAILLAGPILLFALFVAFAIETARQNEPAY